MSERGHTLIEVLVALTIATIAVLGVASLLLRGLATQGQARYHEAAERLLADAGEQLRANAPAAAVALSAQQLAAWQQLIAQRLPPLSVATANGAVATEPAYLGTQRRLLSLHWGSADLGDTTLQRVLLLPEPLPP